MVGEAAGTDKRPASDSWNANNQTNPPQTNGNNPSGASADADNLPDQIMAQNAAASGTNGANANGTTQA